MTEKVAQHTHCQICGKAIPITETLCSEECKQRYKAMIKKRKMLLYIMYALIGFMIIVLLFNNYYWSNLQKKLGNQGLHSANSSWRSITISVKTSSKTWCLYSFIEPFDIWARATKSLPSLIISMWQTVSIITLTQILSPRIHQVYLYFLRGKVWTFIHFCGNIIDFIDKFKSLKK